MTLPLESRTARLSITARMRFSCNGSAQRSKSAIRISLSLCRITIWGRSSTCDRVNGPMTTMASFKSVTG